MSVLRAEGLYKSFVQQRRLIPVLKDLHLELRDGEVVCVIGPSGAGKSTLLRLLAGLDRPDAGQVTLDGAPVQAGTPKLAVMFQTPLLLPWLTVWENVFFGLRFLPGMNGSAARERVDRALERVGLADLADRSVAGLSGGQAQRVALARALVRQSSFLLLDEPLSALDAPTRRELRAEIRQLALSDGIGILWATHDVDEAMEAGDRILLLSPQTGNFVWELDLRRHSDAKPQLQEFIVDSLRRARLQAASCSEA
ncbi:ABC transporter ATP-binding protein [Thermoflexus sp.]|uniref:ABC transporter ATP-binding protein n=1 Tax=Thermoflexus sp. TaxID=1969742 RepID=UPI0025F79052|nr:ATP-binding cassette domain-containing protein [Thermoflexus sp.]MCS6965036.1 ATP-binding cassette domain-containing protein [Thermoflexus sp.]MCX7691089.1 ATP-binding cassette domain-containing protein [Thermoflexus sp.]MDW8184389.1 ATP-binding cassette domain-containing protein [Anaerolineae bacterium]